MCNLLTTKRANVQTRTRPIHLSFAAMQKGEPVFLVSSELLHDICHWHAMACHGTTSSASVIFWKFLENGARVKNGKYLICWALCQRSVELSFFAVGFSPDIRLNKKNLILIFIFLYIFFIFLYFYNFIFLTIFIQIYKTFKWPGWPFPPLDWRLIFLMRGLYTLVMLIGE